MTNVRRFTSSPRLFRSWHFQELIRRQRAWSKARLSHRTVEVVHMIHSRADRRRTGAVGLECKLGFALKLAVDIAAEHLAVVRGGDVIPLPGRMQLVAQQQRSAVPRAGDKRVKTPLIAVDDTQFEQETRVRVLRTAASQCDELAGCRVALGKVKPPLLGRAAVWTKNCLKRELFSGGQRMLIDVNRIIDAVELDRFPKRRLDHLRVAVHLDRQTADLVEPIEGPRSLARRVLRLAPGSRGDHVRNDDERQRSAVHMFRLCRLIWLRPQTAASTTGPSAAHPDRRQHARRAATPTDDLRAFFHYRPRRLR